MKRVRQVLGLGVALFLFVASAPPALADGSVLKRIVESGELRVGMSGAQPPLNMRDKQGNLIGLEVDLARLLAESMGVRPKFVTKPFAQLLPALKAGEVDLILSGMTITPRRNLEAAFVGPYMISGKSILTRSTALAQADEASDLDVAELKLAALEGSTSQSFVELLLPRAKLVTTKTQQDGVQLVIDGKVDALVADLPACIVAVLRHPEAGLVTLLTPLTMEPLGIALPPGDPLLLNLVDNYLDAAVGTGALELIIERWTRDGSWLSQLP